MSYRVKFQRSVFLFIFAILSVTGCSSDNGTDPIADPPNATVVYPVDGAIIDEDISIRAEATSSMGISRVDFLVDGEVIGTDHDAPFSVDWYVGLWANDASHSIVAIVYDDSGAVGVSPSVAVTVSSSAAIRPILVTPEDDYIHNGIGPIQFKWRPVNSASSYQYELYSDDVDSTMFYSTIISDTTFSTSIANDHDLCRWQVRALNGNGDPGAYSEPRKFQVGQDDFQVRAENFIIPGEPRINALCMDETNSRLVGVGNTILSGANLVIVEFDLTGNVMSYTVFDDDGAQNANDIEATSNGNFLVTGSDSASDGAMVILFDENFSEIWRETFLCTIGGSSGMACIQALNGNFIISVFCGSRDPGEFIMSIIGLSQNGDLIFQTDYDANYWDYPNSMVKDLLGNVYVAGWSQDDPLGDTDGILLKLSESGSLFWAKNFGGDGFDRFSDICLVDEGDVVLTGGSASHEGSGNAIWTTKINPQGDQVWSIMYQTSISNEGHRIIPDDNGGYIVAGITHESGQTIDVLVARINENGFRDWNFVNGTDTNDESGPIYLLPTGEVFLVGVSSPPSGGDDSLLLLAVEHQ